MKFAQLPKSGVGFSTYSRESDGGDQWALADVVCALLYLSSRRALNVPKFSVGDMSKREGGKFIGHSSHKNGQDVDIRPLRKDGLNQPVQHNWEPYSRDDTRRLIQDLRRFCKVEAILFNDPVLVGEKLCKAYKGHDNHLHVKFAAKQPEAVKWFQREHGLTVDGVAGAKTIAAIMGLEKSVSAAAHAVPSDAAGEGQEREGSKSPVAPPAPQLPDGAREGESAPTDAAERGEAVVGGRPSDPHIPIPSSLDKLKDIGKEAAPYLKSGIGTSGKASIVAMLQAIGAAIWSGVTSPVGLIFCGLAAGILLFWLYTRLSATKQDMKGTDADKQREHEMKLKLIELDIANANRIANPALYNVIVEPSGEIK